MPQHYIPNKSVSPTVKMHLGFTLIECLIVVTILGVIISIAIPSFLSVQRTWQAKQTRHYIIQSFRLAKATSFTHSQDLILCLADVHNVCHKNANHALLLFSDRDGNDKFDEQRNTIIFKQVLDLDDASVYLRAGRRHHIKFYGSSGLPRGHFGHIKYCPHSDKKKNRYQISLNQQGLYRYKPYSFKTTNCP